MRRVLPSTLLVLYACVVTVGCGDDSARPANVARDDAMAFITLAEAEGVIEKGALAMVRTGGDAELRRVCY